MKYLPVRVPCVFYRTVACAIAFCLLGFQWGCSSSPDAFRHYNPSWLLNPVSENVRVHLKKVGVLYDTGSIVNVQHPLPVEGGLEGAWEGAKEGAGIGSAIAYMGGLAAPVLMVFTVPPGIVAGMATGTAMAPGADEVQQAKKLLAQVVIDMNLPESVVRYGFNTAQTIWPDTFVYLGNREILISEVDSNFDDLTLKGIDSILVFEIEAFGLADISSTVWGEPINPVMPVFLTLRGRVIGTKDNIEYYDTTFRCMGKKQEFTKWAENNAQAFQAELQACYEFLVDLHVENAFFIYTVIPKSLKQIVSISST